MSTQLGGNKALPPPELSFIDFITDATKAVQAKYPDASIKDASAKNQFSSGAGGKYELVVSVTFRIQDIMQVIVTKKDGNFQISTPDNVMIGLPDVEDMTKVKFSPWDFTADNSKLRDNYTNIRLARLPNNPSVKKPVQPYYTFTDDKMNVLGFFGATDGKIYSL